MSQRKRLKKVNKKVSKELLEIRALLTAAYDIEPDYPINMLIEMANKKVKKVFDNVEKNRSILQLVD